MNGRAPFLGVPSRAAGEAEAVVLPLPFERTVSYGGGTAGGPARMLEASGQIELFDEETGVDFETRPAIHTAAPVAPGEGEETTAYLERVAGAVRSFEGRFVLGIGGEHLVTYGAVLGLPVKAEDLTIVQIDAHADMIDRLDGERLSHGTVMRRLWERGCRVVQAGIRSVSREEFELVSRGERVKTFFAHEHAARRDELFGVLRGIEGSVYLTLDVDGLDPSVVPSTGTPQPGGLDWYDTMEMVRAVAAAPKCRLVGADVVEFVPSPHPPGCDLTAAKLAVKILAYRFR